MTSKRTLRRLAPLSAAWLVGLGGCGDMSLVTVTGRVTADGRPVPGALVTFVPDAPGVMEPGPCSQGRTGEDGAYSLAVVGVDTPGCRPGKYDVTVEQFTLDGAGAGGTAGRPARRPVSRFKREVPAAGDTQADIELFPK